MSVRAKFRLQRVESTLYQRAGRKDDGSLDYQTYTTVEMRTLIFNPVSYDKNNPENSAFWDASPAGELKLGTINPEAWSQFELGEAYYLDFTPASD